MGVTQQMAEYITKLPYEKIPIPVVEYSKILILDALGCGVRGSQTDIGKSTFGFAGQLGSAPQATVWGRKQKMASPTAAYVNASATNALDYDDTGKGGHPGSTVISAAFALAEKMGKGGKDLILAVVAGYEVGTRIAQAIEPTWERYQQVHGIGTAQTFGSMAASAKLLGLDMEQTLNAFGIAGAIAPVAHAGKFGWHDKSIPFIKDNVAWPAEAGVRACLLAEQGYLGSESFLDGDKGYWVMAGSDRCNFDRMTDFKKFDILTVSLKPYPCCRWIHTTLDAISSLQTKAEMNPGEIDRVDIYSILPLADFFGKTDPKTFVDLEFSVPCSVALRLHGVPFADWFLPENWKSPKVLELARKIHVKLDQKYQDFFVSTNRDSVRIPSRVEVFLKGGGKLEAYEDVASGSPQKPMSPEERLKKFKGLTAKALSKEDQDEVIGLVTDLEKIERMDAITRFL